MKNLKRIICLILCLCMAVSLTAVQAWAASQVNKITVTVTDPYVGDKPGEATTSTTASTEVTDTQWEGELDEDGRFKAGVEYTVTVTIGMKEDVEKYFEKSTNPNNYTINGKRAKVVSHSRMKVVLSYTFKEAAATKTLGSATYTIAAPVAGEMPTYMEDNYRLYRTREWLGNFNADGSFKAGETYTARVTLTVKDPSATVLKYTSGEKITVNGYPTDLVSTSATSVTFQFRFAPVAEKVAAVPDEEGVLRKADFYRGPAIPGEKPVYDITVAQSDALYVTDVKWSGSFDENGCFKAKQTYSLQFTVHVRDGVNMTIPGGSAVRTREYLLNGDLLTVTSSSGNKTTMSFRTNVEVELPKTVVDMAEIYTPEQADAVGNEQNAYDLIINSAFCDQFLANFIEHDQETIKRNGVVDKILSTLNDEPNAGYPTRMLVDCATLDSGSGGDRLDYFPNLTEVWLGPDMDVSSLVNGIVDHTPFGYEHTDRGPNSWDFVLYISGDKYPEGYRHSLIPFRIRLYYGDVYEAFKKGGDVAGHDWCTKHEYTKEIMTPDRICKYPTCQNATWFWYSCKYCGKPEYNDKHVFKTHFSWADGYYGTYVSATDISGRLDHDMISVIDDKYFLCYNADGDKLYAQSCRWCGVSNKDVELYLDLTEARYKYLQGNNPEIDLKTYQQVAKSNWEKYALPRYQASTSEEPPIGYFVVETDKIVTAKTSSWAANEVKWAAQSDLIDFNLLGSDYTKSINRLQFCAVAVKMAEKLLGEELPAAAAGTFTDTDNLYVRKAFAAGITTGVGNNRFNPDGTLTREQMATFIYRALMYVRDHSDIRFTVYESKLSTYTDSGKIDSWAKDSFGFMNALGLIKGTSDTVLNPDGNCTIEQALLVAYRSLSADKIGWYQCVDWYWDGDAYFLVPSQYMFTGVSHAIGDRVWVSGVEEAVGTWLKVESRDSDRTNTPMFLPASDFKPIKDLKEGDAEQYYHYVPNDK